MLLNKNERNNVNEYVIAKVSSGNGIAFDGIFGDGDSDLDSDDHTGHHTKDAQPNEYPGFDVIQNMLQKSGNEYQDYDNSEGLFDNSSIIEREDDNPMRESFTSSPSKEVLAEKPKKKADAFLESLKNAEELQEPALEEPVKPEEDLQL